MSMGKKLSEAEVEIYDESVLQQKYPQIYNVILEQFTRFSLDKDEYWFSQFYFHGEFLCEFLYLHEEDHENDELDDDLSKELYVEMKKTNDVWKVTSYQFCNDQEENERLMT